jgi:hypothetical protein
MQGTLDQRLAVRILCARPACRNHYQWSLQEAPPVTMPTVLLQRPPTSHQAPSHQAQVYTPTTKYAAQGSSLLAALHKGCPSRQSLSRLG